MSSYPQYFKAALLHQLNMVGVAGFALFGLVSWNILPILVGAAAEAAWLMIAPAVPAFRLSVENKKRSDRRIDVDDRNKKLLQNLPADMQQRYHRLLADTEEIRRTYQSYDRVDASFFSQLGERLDELTEKFAGMLSASHDYAELLRGGGADDVRARIAELEAGAEADDAQVRELKNRQLEVLRQRLDKIAKVRKNSELVRIQIETVEQMVALFREQAVSMKSPDEINGKLDEIMGEFDVRSATIEELEGGDGALFDKLLEDEDKKHVPEKN